MHETDQPKTKAARLRIVHIGTSRTANIIPSGFIVAFNFERLPGCWSQCQWDRAFLALRGGPSLLGTSERFVGLRSEP